MREALWAISRPDDICWRDWDGLGAIYNDCSGDTHVVDALAIELLELLAGSPLSIAGLVVQLADATPELMDAVTTVAFFERQLHSLQALGLVEQIPSTS